MPSFIVLDDVIEQLYQLYRQSVPPDIASQKRSLDEAWAIAAIFAMVEGVVQDWSRLIRIGTSIGVALDALGGDRNLKRQAGELNSTYRARLQTPQTAGTPEAIVGALDQLVISAGGVAGLVYLVQLPRDAAYFNRVAYSRRGIATVYRPQSSDTGVVTVARSAAFFNRGKRWGSATARAVIALVPAIYGIDTAALDLLRTKVSAGKFYAVETWSST